MSVSHSCPNHPKAKKGTLHLVAGPVSECKYHGSKAPTQQPKVVPGL